MTPPAIIDPFRSAELRSGLAPFSLESIHPSIWKICMPTLPSRLQSPSRTRRRMDPSGRPPPRGSPSPTAHTHGINGRLPAHLRRRGTTNSAAATNQATQPPTRPTAARARRLAPAPRAGRLLPAALGSAWSKPKRIATRQAARNLAVFRRLRPSVPTGWTTPPQRHVSIACRLSFPSFSFSFSF